MRIVLDPSHEDVDVQQTVRPSRAAGVGTADFAAHLARIYWRRSRRPLVGLVFILPLVLAYESSAWLVSGELPRNGAESWMRGALAMVGLRHWLILPLLAVLILAVGHRVSRRPWRFSGALLAGMAVECGVWALLLFAFARFVLSDLPGVDPTPLVTATAQITTPSATSRTAHVAASAGAGVYEEMLFRLMTLPILSLLALRLGASLGFSRLLAVLASSLLFASAHEVAGGWTSFSAAEFGFRFAAGLLFAVLFLRRGFGIAVGTHAVYDVLANC